MEVLTILVAAVTVTLPPLDPIVLEVQESVPTVVDSTQEDTVVTDLVDPSTSMEVEVTDTGHTTRMVTTQEE